VVAVVISNEPDAPGIAPGPGEGSGDGGPGHRRAVSREDQDRRIVEVLESRRVDLVAWPGT